MSQITDERHRAEQNIDIIDLCPGFGYSVYNDIDWQLRNLKDGENPDDLQATGLKGRPLFFSAALLCNFKNRQNRNPNREQVNELIRKGADLNRPTNAAIEQRGETNETTIEYLSRRITEERNKNDDQRIGIVGKELDYFEGLRNHLTKVHEVVQIMESGRVDRCKSSTASEFLSHREIGLTTDKKPSGNALLKILEDRYGKETVELASANIKAREQIAQKEATQTQFLTGISVELAIVHEEEKAR